MPSESAIFDKSSDCLHAFNNCLESMATTPWPQEQLDRFNLWAAHGAIFGDFQRRNSMDWRLRDRPELIEMMLQLLVLLEDCLHCIYNLVQGTEHPTANVVGKSLAKVVGNQAELQILTSGMSPVSSPSSESSLASSIAPATGPAYAVGDPMSTFKVNAEQTIDKLFRLSAVIRSAGMSYRYAKAANFVEYEKEVNLTQKFREGVELLFKHKEPPPSSYLLKRLIETICLRQRQLAYSQRQSIGQFRKVIGLQTSESQSGTMVPPRAESAYMRRQGPVSSLSKIDQLRTLKRKREELENPAQSVAYTATYVPSVVFPKTNTVGLAPIPQSFSTIDESLENIPLPPDTTGKSEVICPYCAIPYEQAKFKGAVWRNHFLEDFRPYICILPDCKTPHAIYNDSTGWMSHMQTEHKVAKWKCAATTHAVPEVFDTEADFVTHTTAEHKGAFMPKEVLELANLGRFDVSRKLQENLWSMCPLCTAPFDDLGFMAIYCHIARDLFDYAMLSLPEAPLPAAAQSQQDSSSGASIGDDGIGPRRQSDVETEKTLPWSLWWDGVYPETERDLKIFEVDLMGVPDAIDIKILAEIGEDVEMARRMRLLMEPDPSQNLLREYNDDLAPKLNEPKMSDTVRHRWNLALNSVMLQTKTRKMLHAYNQYKVPSCVVCSSMNLTEEKFRIMGGDKDAELTTRIASEELVKNEDKTFAPGGSSFVLGTLEEINRRSEGCLFCRLVIQSIAVERDNGRSQHDMRALELSTLPQSIHHWADINAVCFVTWVDDGTLFQRDASGEIYGLRVCTRRLRLSWSLHHNDHLYFVLMLSNALKPNPIYRGPGLFLGQIFEKNGTLDTPKFRQWFETCDRSHGAACQRESHDFATWKSFFGVIDVIDMRLTSLGAGERYLALSYVWGTGISFGTRQDTVGELLLPGGLRKQWSSLPRTIRDAISLVRDLGERYLWVDSICIIQDSARSWLLNSRIMDRIFGNSYLTICAADGQDANAGLRALSSGAPPKQIIQPYSREILLMCSQPAEKYIRNSTWNSRAWTLQERLLSKRTLIFVDGRVYYQCRRTTRSLDIITDASAGWSIDSLDSPHQLLNRLAESPLWVYQSVLGLYLGRSLTFSRDILHAFTGIGNVLCKALGGRHIYGLPSGFFDWALLWEGLQPPSRRARESTFGAFPSWSWCGWIGEMIEYKKHMLLGCEENPEEWLMNHTWINWYIRDNNGNLRLVWEADESLPKRGYNCVNDQYQGEEIPVYDKYGRYVKEVYRNLPRHEFRLVLSEYPYGVTVVDTSLSIPSPANMNEDDIPYLQFYTWSSHLRIEMWSSGHYFGSAFQRFNILDYRGSWCGSILLDRQWALSQDLERPFEFIAISEAKFFDESDFDEDDSEKSTVQVAWKLYYVLLIQNEGNVASRVGLGKVSKDGFAGSTREGGKLWKEFILG